VTTNEFEEHLAPQRDASFDFNVFVVGDVDVPGTDSGVYVHTFASAMVAEAGGPRDRELDPLGAPALTIAHEAGHFLQATNRGGGGHTEPDTLMGDSGKPSIRIPKDDVDSLNPYSG
jgi:hypothetical protein